MTCASAVSTATLVPGAAADGAVPRYGRADDIGAARIDDDQLGALAQPLLQARGKDRMAIGRVGADDDHDIGSSTLSKSCVPAEVPKVA
jgi:hypothetical protein